MRKTWLIVIAIVMFVLAACSPAGDTSGDLETGISQETSGAELQDDYNGALSIQGQLAVGTLLLEETALAVDEVLAVELYPLWQALQSLSDSDTAAEVEVQAVVNQIQGTMTPEQVAGMYAGIAPV